MSFGTSVSDIGYLIKLAKDTVQRCRNAPSDFAEASRVCQSLYLMLEAVQTEAENPESPLYKDDRTRTDFVIHIKNCEMALKPLAKLIENFTSLGSSKARLIDRLRFSKREYLEYRGNLSFYTARLSEFLQMVGLGSLGRIEQKVEHIKEDLPKLMIKIDQMCAELRLQGDQRSLLSDHTDDEKFVWKVFRRKLNDAGFTSNVLREHEAQIFLRIRELTTCGLLSSDGSSLAWTDNGSTQLKDTPALRTEDRVTESTNHTSIPNHEFSTTASVDNKQRQSNITSSQTASNDRFSDGSDDNNPLPSNKSDTTSNEDTIRKWRNADGQSIIEGKLAPDIFRGGKTFIAIVDRDNDEVLVPCSNVCYDDLAFAEAIANQRNGERLPSYEMDQSSQQNLHPDDDPDEVVDKTRRSGPRRSVGKRTHRPIKWKYRAQGSEPPQPPAILSRDALTGDVLPSAAARGDLKTVKKLLAIGEHIESRGPKSWTETTGSGDNQTSVRHSFPETTALYRAAHAGWIDVALYLLENGADVNTRDGYNGVIGEAILFKVVRIGDEKITRLLLEFGAKIQFRQTGSTTALHVASSYPKRSIVRLLLDFNAKINVQNAQCKTPLYLASDGGKSGGFIHNVELLLQEGAKTDILSDQGQSALYKASGHGRDDIVQVLLEYGADPAIGRGRYGETAIFKAAWQGDDDIVEMLLDYGADVNLKNSAKMESYRGVGERLLHGIMSVVAKEHPFMNNWGKTALHAAAYQGDVLIVEMLLNAGADPEMRGNDDSSPLYIAANQNHEEVVQMLLKAGAKLDSSRDPVLALLERKNQRKTSNPDRKGVDRPGPKHDLARIGTNDVFVGMVADVTKSFMASRRGENPGIAANLLTSLLSSHATNSR